MFSFRGTALRVLHRPSSAIRSLQSARSITTRISTTSSSLKSLSSIPRSSTALSFQFASRSSTAPLLIHRTYATDDPGVRDPDAVLEAEEAMEAAEEAAAQEVVQEAAAEVAEEAAEEAVENAQEAAVEAARAMDTAAEAAQKAETAVDAAAAATTTAAANPRVGSVQQASPNVVYVGNLFFDISEATIQHEFETIGPVDNVKIIRDARGLSKGFGYVTMQTEGHAKAAIENLNNGMLAGRHMIVQPSRGTRSTYRPRAHPDAMEGYLNPPGKTLFIGNMSYEMTDKDLNDLFRKIKNVLDVRVAIDRRTGQPRGFAHADFTDTNSALEAAQFLKTQEYYGRFLRIDFTSPGTGGHRFQRNESGQTAPGGNDI